MVIFGLLFSAFCQFSFLILSVMPGGIIVQESAPKEHTLP